jgi:peptide/nickel transport system substrate-binding protein
MSNGGSHFWNIGQKSPATEWERRIDELMLQQAASTDAEARKRLFNDVQRLFAENLPMLYFAAPRVYVATSSRLINLRPSVTRPQLMWSADTLALRDLETSQ